MGFSLVYGHGASEAQSALILMMVLGLALGLVVRRDQRLWWLWLALPLALAHAAYWISSPDNDFASSPLGFRVSHSALVLLRATPIAAAFIGAMLWLEPRGWARQFAVRAAASLGIAVTARAVQYWLGLAW